MLLSSIRALGRDEVTKSFGNRASEENRVTELRYKKLQRALGRVRELSGQPQQYLARPDVSFRTSVDS